jgi:hypothetical protein
MTPLRQRMLHEVERMTVAQLFFTEQKKEYRLDSS